MLLQPVYCRSAIRSHVLSSEWKTETFHDWGTLSCSDTSPLDNTSFTPAASNPAIGANAGGSVAGSCGLLKLTWPLTVYLIAERYWAPKRVSLSGSNSRPIFQPQALSLPLTAACDSSPLTPARRGGMTLGGMSPPAAACAAAVASAPE